MSHYTVAVIHSREQDIENLLAPYDENSLDKFKDCTEKVESLKEEYEDISELLDDYGYDEYEGKYGYWYNPNVKWDWWIVGGRWRGKLKNDKGFYFDSMPIDKIDFTPDEEDYKRLKRWYEVKVENAPLLPTESKKDFYIPHYTKDYYDKRYGVS